MSAAVIAAMNAANAAAQAQRKARGALLVTKEEAFHVSGSIRQAIDRWRDAEVERLIDTEIEDRKSLNRFLPSFMKRSLDRKEVLDYLDGGRRIHSPIFSVQITYGMIYQTAGDVMAMAKRARSDKLEVSAADWADLCRAYASWVKETPKVKSDPETQSSPADHEAIVSNGTEGPGLDNTEDSSSDPAARKRPKPGR
jgi:hypothetical protein